MNDATRRIMAEVKEFATLNTSPQTFFVAAPLDTDLFEWHFTVRGPPDTPFADGLYHGRILLPPEYPLKAPEIVLLTPNGRFELNVPICLSVTAHHQETWQPSWGIRTILTALVGFMPSPAEGLGALDFPDHERRRLAHRSRSFLCSRCGARPADQFPAPHPGHRLGSAPAATPGSAAADAALRRAATAAAAPTTPPASPADADVDAPTPSPAEQPPAPVPAPRAPQLAAQPTRAHAAAAEERGLLYAAYAIVALIFAILGRRLF